MALCGAVSVGLVCGPLSAQARVELPAEVVFGAEFELMVASVEAFDAKKLRPLVVSRHEALADGSGTRVWARCYECGEVVLAAAGGGSVRLQVRSSLPEGARLPLLPAEYAAELAIEKAVENDRTNPSSSSNAAKAWPPLEWPNDGYDRLGTLRDGTVRFWFWLTLAGGLLLVVGSWFRRRRAAPQSSPVEAAAAAQFDARGAIEQLAPPACDADATRYCLELKAIVRRALAARFDLPADVRTTEELLATASLPDAVRGAMRPCLLPCDGVLFGPPQPEATSQLDEVRDAAFAFVAEVDA